MHFVSRYSINDSLQETLARWCSHHRWSANPTKTAGLLAVLAGAKFTTDYVVSSPIVFSDVFYVPTLLAAIFFGLRGGLLMGLASGILSTSFPSSMFPTHVETDAILRGAFFVLFGAFVGATCDSFRRKMTKLEGRMRHSAVSGLPNSAALEQDLNALIAKHQNSIEGLTVAEVRIPNIDDLMAVFGHHILHQLLPRIAANLKRAARSSHVYQLHYDRFAIVSTDTEHESIGKYCDSLLASIPQSVDFEGAPLQLIGSGRVGVAHFPAHGLTAVDIMRASRLALQAAVDRNEPYAIFEKGAHHERRMMLERLSELRHAIDNHELVFHYQPKLNLHTNCYTSAEALVRWNHPTGELLAPAAFLPVAEKTEIITRLSAWGLRAAITQIAAWERDGIDLNLGIAINLSAMDLRSDATIRTLRELLSLHGVNPHRLEIEVTETSIIKDIDLAKRHLEQIRALGVKIAIDDFGTGHAGLAQLRDLPVDSVKIDQIFVKHMLDQPKDAMIVRAATRLGHNLGLEVVAEGVETREALDLIRECGCDVAQGFAIARPMSESELRKLVPLRRATSSLRQVR